MEIGTYSVTKQEVAPKLKRYGISIIGLAGHQVEEHALDNTRSSRRCQSKDVHMRHNVVPSFLLLNSSFSKLLWS